MHLLIIGATGRTGKYACNYALNQGHHVTVIVRKSSTLLPCDNLRVIQGSSLSEEDIDFAFTSAHTPIDAALQFLNHSGNSSPPRLLADTSANLARALRKYRCGPTLDKPRLVIMNAVGAGQSYNTAPWLARIMIRFHSGTARIYRDHDAVDAEIEKHCLSEITWTLAMAVGLQYSGIKHVQTFAVEETGARWFITRESCARWMIDVAVGREGNKFNNQRIVISN